MHGRLELPYLWLPLQAFVITCNVEKNNRHHQKICNGFTGYNGTCIGFNGNCNGPCLVSTGNWSPSIGGLLKPINPNGICPKTTRQKPFFNGFNG